MVKAQNTLSEKSKSMMHGYGDEPHDSSIPVWLIKLLSLIKRRK